MKDFDIRKDKLVPITVFDGETEHEFMVSARYDRIDHYERLGVWILKIMDDQLGLIEGVCSEDFARNIAKVAMLPIVEREFIYESEHELFIDAIGQNLDQIFGSD